MTLFLIILFTLLGGALSVIAAALFLLAPERLRERVLPHFISFAIGAMVSVAFIELLPHAMLSPGVRDIHTISFAVLFGLLGFFILEKMILWRHCHSFECEAHTPEHPPQGPEHGHGQRVPGKKAAGMLIVFGDGLHNFVDGILIAAAFLTDTHLGIVTALVRVEGAAYGLIANSTHHLGGAIDAVEGFLGHSPHPAVVAVPIGAWTVSNVCDGLALATGNERYDDVARVSMAVGLAGAAVIGWLAARWRGSTRQ